MALNPLATPGTGNKKTTRRIAPDETNYHVLDGTFDPRHPMTSDRTVVIPKATRDGISRNFDPHLSDVVVIDPLEPDSFELDCRVLSQRAVKRAMATTEDPHDVFAALADRAPRPVQGSRRPFDPVPAPSRPPARIPAPRRPVIDIPVQEDNMAISPRPARRLQPLRQPQPQYEEQEETQETQAPPRTKQAAASGSQTAAIVESLGQVAESLSYLNDRMDRLERPRKKKRPSRVPTSFPQDAERAAPQPPPSRAASSTPAKPGTKKHRVIFQVAGGQVQGWFHKVIDSPNCVVLGFDTSDDATSQFLPDEVKTLMDITIRSPKGDQDRSYKVLSAGLVWSEDNYDYVLLAKSKQDEYPQEGE